ncbi:alpha/beta hydrolase [Sphingomonas sp. CGMCC 1.13654]|uniref:Alpha/beta hydrolase n=2 Tax=Sphingomonas chungangi TaxID=2683589 RepID=A0A838L2D4_9SPHN|nr:alpha/beta hydrolase [Sphingomonas chungangi]
MSASPIGARTYGPRLEGFDYPFPVREYRTVAQGQSVEMAYMEVAPAKSNGRTVVLLHGKNFCGATWGDTARVLAAAGYRVIVPDQIGFCKSSKPTGFQYSLYGMATMTADLLRSRGVTKATLVGHSLGGMIAERLAIAQPQLVDQMILVDPLGLADRMAQGVPYITIDKAADLERRKTPASMKTYQLSSYYHGVWRRDYDRWVDMMAGMYAGPGRDAVIDAQARTTEMIETQPTAYEFGRITVPTILMVGTLDHNVFGRNWAPPEVANQLPEASTLGDKAAARMKDARFVPLQGLGHVPQIEDPARFQIALIQALSGAL